MYDVIIVGGGPAGLTAGLYCVRAGLKTLVIESAFAGGQIITASLVENYPGFPGGIGGFELGERMHRQADEAGLKMVSAVVTELGLQGDVKRIKTGKEDYECRAVILAMGAKPRKLGIPGEDRFIGSGVSYCATCDGALFKGRNVAVIGGGDTAAGDAIYLAPIASRVHLVHRRDVLRASAAQASKALGDERVEKHFGVRLLSINGDMRVQSLSIEGKNGAEELPVDAVFVAVGMEPQTALLEGQLALDGGYVAANEDTRTSLPGVFAAGDIRKKPLRQVVTAASDGAVAAYMAEQYLSML